MLTDNAAYWRSEGSRFEPGETKVYSDVWLTVHRNSAWIRKTN